MKFKHSIYNIIIGFMAQIVQLILGLFIPRLFLINFGSEVNGLISSINQVFVYIGLLEAGVGAASIQALYKPISEKDKDGINSILSATNIYYKNTSKYYFVAILLLAIIYPFVIKTNINKIEISIIILLSGLGGVINFIFQGKYRLLLTAEGKDYINTIITTAINIIASIAKIVLLMKDYNVIIIQLVYFAISIIQMTIIQIYINKYYKWINLKIKPNYEAIKQKNSVLIHQVSSLIFSNTDIIILTIFCDLKVVSVYMMYNMFFSIIDNIISPLNNGTIFAFGQSFNEKNSKFLKMYDLFEVYFYAFAFSVYLIAFTFVEPFIKLYTAGITDISYIDPWLPVLFVVLKLLSCARTPTGNLINIAGHFKNTQYRSIIESIINIIFSLIFVKKYGIYGVLMGTIVALLYRSLDIIVYTNKNILSRSSWITMKRLTIDLILFIVFMVIFKKINIYPLSYFNIIISAVFLGVIVLITYFVTNSLLEKGVYKFTKEYFFNYFCKLFSKKI